MLRKTTSASVEKICTLEKQRLINSISKAEDSTQWIFDLFLLVTDAQEEAYRAFDLEKGFIPKGYEKVLQDILGVFQWESFLFESPHTIRYLKLLLEEAKNLACVFDRHAPVFSQIKVFVDGVLKETQYSLFNSAFSFTLGHGFSYYGKGPSFQTKGIGLGTDIELKSKVVPCPLPLFASIIMSILDDDNWKIEEVDAEHFEGQVFQWDKAFADLFEVKND